MKAVLAIDPGNLDTAWVRVVDGLPVAFDKAPNHDVLDVVAMLAPVDLLAIEWPAQAGPGGVTILDTAAWAGRFLQRWLDAGGATASLVKRVEVKRHLLGNVAGKRGGPKRSADAQVRDVLIARYGGAGAIGTKAAPGPLHGIANDVWQALAVAVTFDETIRHRPEGTS